MEPYWHDSQRPERHQCGFGGGLVDCGGTYLYGDGPCGQGSLQNVRHEPKMNLQSASPLVQPRSSWCEAQQQLRRWKCALSQGAGGGGSSQGSGASMLTGDEYWAL